MTVAPVKEIIVRFQEVEEDPQEQAELTREFAEELKRLKGTEDGETLKTNLNAALQDLVNKSDYKFGEGSKDAVESIERDLFASGSVYTTGEAILRKKLRQNFLDKEAAANDEGRTAHTRPRMGAGAMSDVASRLHGLLDKLEEPVQAGTDPQTREPLSMPRLQRDRVLPGREDEIRKQWAASDHFKKLMGLTPLFEAAAEQASKITEHREATEGLLKHYKREEGELHRHIKDYRHLAQTHEDPELREFYASKASQYEKDLKVAQDNIAIARQSLDETDEGESRVLSSALLFGRLKSRVGWENVIALIVGEPTLFEEGSESHKHFEQGRSDFNALVTDKTLFEYMNKLPGDSKAVANAAASGGVEGMQDWAASDKARYAAAQQAHDEWLDNDGEGPMPERPSSVPGGGGAGDGGSIPPTGVPPAAGGGDGDGGEERNRVNRHQILADLTDTTSGRVPPQSPLTDEQVAKDRLPGPQLAAVQQARQAHPDYKVYAGAVQAFKRLAELGELSNPEALQAEMKRLGKAIDDCNGKLQTATGKEAKDLRALKAQYQGRVEQIQSALPDGLGFQPFPPAVQEAFERFGVEEVLAAAFEMPVGFAPGSATEVGLNSLSREEWDALLLPSGSHARTAFAAAGLDGLCGSLDPKEHGVMIGGMDKLNRLLTDKVLPKYDDVIGDTATATIMDPPQPKKTEATKEAERVANDRFTQHIADVAGVEVDGHKPDPARAAEFAAERANKHLVSKGDFESELEERRKNPEYEELLAEVMFKLSGECKEELLQENRKELKHVESELANWQANLEEFKASRDRVVAQFAEEGDTSPDARKAIEDAEALVAEAKEKVGTFQVVVAKVQRKLDQAENAPNDLSRAKLGPILKLSKAFPPEEVVAAALGMPTRFKGKHKELFEKTLQKSELRDGLRIPGEEVKGSPMRRLLVRWRRRFDPDFQAELLGSRGSGEREAVPSSVRRKCDALRRTYGEQGVEAAKAIEDFHQSRYDFYKTSMKIHSDIQSILNSGMPIELMIMLVMVKLVQKEEEKFKDAMREMGAAEQIERINNNIKEDNKHLRPGQKPKKELRLTDYGLTAKPTTILMQEMQVAQQMYMQTMNALSEILKQTQDLVMSIIRKIN